VTSYYSLIVSATGFKMFTLIKIIQKTLVYHTVNGDLHCFISSKTAKMIKAILLRAPSQNVNVLLSNITFIIFAVFDV